MKTVKTALESLKLVAAFLLGYLSHDAGLPLWIGLLWCSAALLVLAWLEGFIEGLLEGVRNV